MNNNICIKDNFWFSNIKWDNGCLKCHSNNNGTCPDKSCAEYHYDYLGEPIPVYFHYSSRNNTSTHFKENAREFNTECHIHHKTDTCNKADIQDFLVNNYITNAGVLTKDQLGNDLYLYWIKLIYDLYKFANSIMSSEEWTTIDSIQEHSQKNDLYCKLNDIYEVIGDVKNHPLHRDKDFDLIIYSYLNTKIEDFESYIPEGSRLKTIFRYRLERYLARNILLQKLTPNNIINDVANEKRLLRRMKRVRKGKIEKIHKKNISITPEKLEIEFGTFTVISNAFRCNKNHSIIPIQASIEILTSGGSIIKELFSAGYCRDCNVFFILEKDFKNMKSKGILLCQLITEADYVSASISNDFNLKAESLLHRCGYNVNSSDGLTTIQRQEILSRVIDNNLYSISGLLSFLDWLIERANKTQKKNMSSAIKKWEADRKFVANYNMDTQNILPISKIKTKR